MSFEESVRATITEAMMEMQGAFGDTSSEWYEAVTDAAMHAFAPYLPDDDSEAEL